MEEGESEDVPLEMVIHESFTDFLTMVDMVRDG